MAVELAEFPQRHHIRATLANVSDHVDQEGPSQRGKLKLLERMLESKFPDVIPFHSTQPIHQIELQQVVEAIHVERSHSPIAQNACSTLHQVHVSLKKVIPLLVREHFHPDHFETGQEPKVSEIV